MGPVPNSEHSHVNPLLIQLVERLRLLPEVQAVQSEREPSGMQVGDGWLASPVQVHLDLLRGEGRSKEMAAHLRREKIEF